MERDYVDLSAVDSGDRLAKAAANFANAAYHLTTQLSLTELPDSEQPFFIVGRDRLYSALGAIRKYAMGADNHPDRLKAAYFDACYGVGVVSSFVTKFKPYDSSRLSTVQHEFGEAMAKIFYP